MPKLPYGYKVLQGEEWTGLGKLAGSSQPGGASYGRDDDAILAKLEDGKTIEQAGVDELLLLNLDSLYQEGVRTIYNLVLPPSDRNPMLIKKVWEDKFADTKYVTSINEVSTAIEDFRPPSQDQLQLITDDAVEKIRNGEHILVHCRGGMGRTGTILSAIYMKLCEQYDARQAISYVREHYSYGAVETRSQEESLRVFGRELQQKKAIQAREDGAEPTSFAEKEKKAESKTIARAL